MDLTKEIRCVISTQLAEGKSSQEVVELLCETNEVEEQEAVDCLREYYQRWQKVIEALGYEQDDYLNWHTYMRHKALQIALRDSKPAAALSILDSLAKLQGLSDIKDDRIIPLVIELHEKKDTNDEQSKEQQLPKEEERSSNESTSENPDSIG